MYSWYLFPEALVDVIIPISILNWNFEFCSFNLNEIIMHYQVYPYIEFQIPTTKQAYIQDYSAYLSI